VDSKTQKKISRRGHFQLYQWQLYIFFVVAIAKLNDSDLA
jgi:hypothetical protein